MDSFVQWIDCVCVCTVYTLCKFPLLLCVCLQEYASIMNKMMFTHDFTYDIEHHE